MKPRIIGMFTNINMGCSFNGLSEIARKHKINLLKLNVQECVLFVNKKQNKAKILGGNGLVIGYLSMPTGTITEKNMDFISHVFGGSGIEWNTTSTNQWLKTKQVRNIYGSKRSSASQWRQQASA